MELREQILEKYVAHLREHGTPPQAVFPFCRDLGIGEREFFGLFASLDAVESEFWKDLVSRVAAAVSGGSEWATFSARQQMLAFLFAFLEESLNVRSLMLSRFAPLRLTDRPGWLDGFESAHRELLRQITERGRESGEIAPRGPLEQLYPGVLHLHLRAVIAFHLHDTSAGFERTDAFVEKSVNFAFDAIGRQVVDSGFDLVRFLAPQHWSR